MNNLGWDKFNSPFQGMEQKALLLFHGAGTA